MTLQIYGSFRSRTRRVLWAALELGLDFEHVPYAWHDPALKRPDYLSINPLGRIPAIRDGDLLLSESLAITLHLANRYGRGGDHSLYPEAEEALIWQWTLFAASDLDPWVVLFSEHTAWLAEADRVAALAELGRGALDRSIEDHPHVHAWLHGALARPAALAAKACP